MSLRSVIPRQMIAVCLFAENNRVTFKSQETSGWVKRKAVSSSKEVMVPVHPHLWCRIRENQQIPVGWPLPTQWEIERWQNMDSTGEWSIVRVGRRLRGDVKTHRSFTHKPLWKTFWYQHCASHRSVIFKYLKDDEGLKVKIKILSTVHRMGEVFSNHI